MGQRINCQCRASLKLLGRGTYTQHTNTRLHGTFGTVGTVGTVGSSLETPHTCLCLQLAVVLHT